MRAYSLDLRRKIVEAYLNSQGSMRQLATGSDMEVVTIQSTYSKSIPSNIC
jgi:transposase-like protein